MRLKRALSKLLTLTLLLTHVAPSPSRMAFARGVQQEDAEGEDEKKGLRFRLSEGAAPKESPHANRVAEGRPLTEAETARLLARLPPPVREADDERAFSLREGTLRPPRAGQTVVAAFAAPMPAAPPTPSVTSGALEVLRFAPEGEVEVAPTVSLTFSQPMVAVASQNEAASNVPVSITPRVAGSWRWLGTHTLVFKPEAEGGRLPAATVYTVAVPTGTKSAAGAALTRARTYNFSTPPPTLKRKHPEGEGHARDAVIFMQFDQRVDAARLLELIRMETPAPGTHLRQATAEEIAADAEVSRLVKDAQPGRWLALRAVRADGSTKDALPPGANVRLVIPVGTPSAEGPRVTKERQNFSFKTYEALRVKGVECGDGRSCAPSDQLRLEFNNQIDAHEFSVSQVTITPSIPDAQINLVGDAVHIDGDKRGGMTYTVTLARNIKDAFGQTLSGATRFTFRVGHEEPALFAPGDGFVVLDPARRGSFSVYSINLRRLKVSLYRVKPEDWGHFRSYEALRASYPVGEKVRRNLKPPGSLVFQRVVEVRSKPDELIENSIDLSPALVGGYGQVFVRVERVEPPSAPVRVHAYGPADGAADAWVQATDIGLDAFADNHALYAWANSLRDGRPLGGVEVLVVPEAVSGVTGTDGLARIAFAAGEKSGRPLLVARHGADVAILPQSHSAYDDDDTSAWRRADDETKLAWYVFDDRRLYRPGEEVSIKGWVRSVSFTPRGDTGLFTPRGGEALEYVARDSQGNEIAKGAARLNALAGFDLSLKLPSTMSLGQGRVDFKLPGSGEEHTHHFAVQEFRRPEFEVEARASAAPHFVGGLATATVEASYYAGGGLAGAEVEWTVSARAADYTPPGRDDYTFGVWTPWWEKDDESPAATRQQFKSRTDAAGQHTLRLDFDSVNPPRPTSLTAVAQVMDVNRQALSAQTTLLVHPSDVYVGLKTARTFVREGEPFDVRLVVTDLDGRALAGRDVSLRLARLDYVYEDGEWTQKESDVREQSVRSGADESGALLPTKGGGVYRLTARVRDERGRPNESELTLWVAGGVRRPGRGVELEEVELIPDRREYRAGDVAEILVRAPFTPAEGVLTLRRSGVLRTERFRMSGGSHVLRVPLEEGWTPNVHVQVDLVGAAPRVDEEGREHASLPKRPAYAAGELNIEIPPASRRLNVKATPREGVLEPGRETVVDVEVRDAEGRGVQGTDTAVVVVDESVLALTDYKLSDPLSVFYAEREEGADDYHLREHVELASTEALLRGEGTGLGPGRGSNIGGGGPGGGGGGSVDYMRAYRGDLTLSAAMEVAAPVTMATPAEIDPGVVGGADDAQLILRRNFNALAVFAASLPTDSAGSAQVRVRLPDNLTRYRVMAVSVAAVDLPAPFSPRSAWTSPARTSNETPRSAWTPAKALVIPVASSSIGERLYRPHVRGAWGLAARRAECVVPVLGARCAACEGAACEGATCDGAGCYGARVRSTRHQAPSHPAPSHPAHRAPGTKAPRTEHVVLNARRDPRTLNLHDLPALVAPDQDDGEAVAACGADRVRAGVEPAADRDAAEDARPHLELGRRLARQPRVRLHVGDELGARTHAGLGAADQVAPDRAAIALDVLRPIPAMRVEHRADDCLFPRARVRRGVRRPGRNLLAERCERRRLRPGVLRDVGRVLGRELPRLPGLHPGPHHIDIARRRAGDGGAAMDEREVAVEPNVEGGRHGQLRASPAQHPRFPAGTVEELSGRRRNPAHRRQRADRRWRRGRRRGRWRDAAPRRGLLRSLTVN